MDPDEDDDALTNRVEKIDPDATPLPPPLPAGAKDLGPAQLPELPTIEVSESPVEVLPPRPHFPPPPPRPAPRPAPPPARSPAPAPITVEHAAALPPPLPPPPLPEPAPVERPGVDLARRLRGASSTDEVKALPDPLRRRKRLWPAALVVIAGVSLFTAVVMAVVAHMNSVHLEQQRLAAERLAAELRAQAEQLRHERGVIALPSPAPTPEPETPPVAGASAGRRSVPAGSQSGRRRAARFCIDLYEYPGGKTIPRTDVPFDGGGAVSAPRAAQRLCSDDEWERACRGKSRRQLPLRAVVRSHPLQHPGLGRRARRPPAASRSAARPRAPTT